MQCCTNPMTLSHTLPPTCSMRRSVSCTLLCEAEQGCLVSSPSAQLWSRPKVFHEGNIICHSKRLQQLQRYKGFWSKIHYVKSTLRVQHYVKQNQPLICSLKLSDFLLENINVLAIAFNHLHGCFFQVSPLETEGQRCLRKKSTGNPTWNILN